VPVIVREALPQEMEAIGALRVRAYQAQGLLAADPPYARVLRSLGADGHGTVLVAAEDREILGTVMLEPWHDGSEVARGGDEAEVRALAVAPSAQRRGVARALMRAAMDLAAMTGAARLLLCTRPEMAAAQALYRSLGFGRLPALDWVPVPGVTLLAFGIPMDAAGQS
jgi:ribosomal protein S18 acetylase RimI-like enzyme